MAALSNTSSPQLVVLRTQQPSITTPVPPTPTPGAIDPMSNPPSPVPSTRQRRNTTSTGGVVVLDFARYMLKPEPLLPMERQSWNVILAMAWFATSGSMSTPACKSQKTPTDFVLY